MVLTTFAHKIITYYTSPKNSFIRSYARFWTFPIEFYRYCREEIICVSTKECEGGQVHLNDILGVYIHCEFGEPCPRLSKYNGEDVKFFPLPIHIYVSKFAKINL